MTVAKFEFNLPEDRYDFETHCNVHKYRSALDEIKTKLKSRAEYDRKAPKLWAKLYAEFWDILNDEGIEDV